MQRRRGGWVCDVMGALLRFKGVGKLGLVSISHGMHEVK
jgi:hypothetical protein